MPKQTYQYKIADSILGMVPDNFALTIDEYYRIYTFFVTYSMCDKQSAKKRSFSDYGWQNGNIKNTALGNALAAVLNLNRNPHFIFTDKNELGTKFNALDLPDGIATNLAYERAVVGKTSESNNYMKLFYRIRDGFAHGKFKLRFSTTNEKMVVIQDDDGHNVTARIIIKLDTLLNFVSAIDINGLI